MVKIKLCGLSSMQDILVANSLQVDYIGFVFARSKRQVTKAQAKQLKLSLNKNIQAVGVFVEQEKEMIGQFVEDRIIDVIQLHGKQTKEDVAWLKQHYPNTPIFQAISVRDIHDIIFWNDSLVDYLLLDYGKGGTGQCFDWEVLKDRELIKKEFFIAGGLDASNVQEVMKYYPNGVDVSGGIETNGTKDPLKMEQFVKKVRGKENE